MNLNDIRYERNLTGSYMILSCDSVSAIDEEILTKHRISGLVSMNRCYIDDRREYWYDISGKQALDSFSQYNDMSLDFFERVVISACQRIELLEKNLVNTDCLILLPHLIYVDGQGEEVFFVAVPTEEKISRNTFINLIEYLLTKLDHSNPEAVHVAYGIYQKALNENSGIEEIRKSIIDSRKARTPEVAVQTVVREVEIPEETIELEPEELTPWQKIMAAIKGFLTKKVVEDEDEEIVVYPEEYEERPKANMPPEIHPTVCLSDYREHPQGLLLYEGLENFSNISLISDMIRIGQGNEAEAIIDKGTVSHFHAVIHKESEEFYLEDLNSTNGTYVNGQALNYKEKRQLKMNDIIKFADVKYRFV